MWPVSCGFLGSQWSTGAELFLAFGLVSAFSEELVGHSLKWTTGSGLFLVFGPFPAFSEELVVHSTEWTTGSQPFSCFQSAAAKAQAFWIVVLEHSAGDLGEA